MQPLYYTGTQIQLTLIINLKILTIMGYLILGVALVAVVAYAVHKHDKDGGGGDYNPYTDDPSF
jgi:hypothetical protein